MNQKLLWLPFQVTYVLINFYGNTRTYDYNVFYRVNTIV